MTFCPICGDELEEGKLNVHLNEEHTIEERMIFDSKNSTQQPPTQIIRGENFSKSYATNFNINPTEEDLRIDILNEKRIIQIPQGGQMIQLISEHQIIATPLAAKRLQISLTEILEHLESQFGEIKVN